jgi:L-aspartate oxidase
MTADISTLAGRPVIIGGGAAGLLTALLLAPEPVVLLSKAPLGAEASSLWAQGGLAAAMGEDDDPALHVADTIAAGAGLCDEEVARRIVHAWKLAARPRSRAWPQPYRSCHRRRHRPRDHARADISGAPLSVDHAA